MLNRLRRTALPVALVAALLSSRRPPRTAVPVTVNLRVEGISRHDLRRPGHHRRPSHDDADRWRRASLRRDERRRCAHARPPSARWMTRSKAGRLRMGRELGHPASAATTTRSSRSGRTTIDPITHYLAFYLNWQFADLGGCSQSVKQGDDVLFAHSNFSQSKVLRLSGPTTADDRPERDGAGRGVRRLNGTPASGASVGGATTGADGSATLSFPEKGIYRLKAERADAVRSNAVVLCVDPPGAAPCTSTDGTAPSVESGFGDGRPGAAGPPSRQPRRTLAHDPRVVGGPGRRRQRRRELHRRGEQGERRRRREPGRLEDAPRQDRDERAALPRRLRRRLPVPHHRDRPRAELRRRS